MTATSDDVGGINTELTAGPHDGTFWVFDLGAELPVQEFLVVTFDIHYGMNLDTESKYLDRIDSSGNFHARNDHELRLMLGVGYAHDFLL